MGVLGPVQIRRSPVLHRGHHHAVGGPIAGELVGDDHLRHLLQALEQSADQPLGVNAFRRGCINTSNKLPCWSTARHG